MATEQNNSPVESSPSATLTLRMIMQGKEAGSIIGKKGDNVKKYREDSGAKINISDSSCPERIVTVTGSTQSIYKAFSMVCKKFEEDINNLPTSGAPKPPVTVRLVVPASQCGSLIGKGGAKIKDIREVTGASIQVASEMLPNSTERTVTISGSADAITDSVYHICCVMLECPPKGATIPYRPKPLVPPVIMAGGQAFAVQGQYTLPQPDPNYARPGMIPYHHTPTSMPPQITKLALQQGMIPAGLPYINTQQGMLPAGVPGAIVPRPNHPQIQAPNHPQQTHEINIPNDLIGCIIGRGGAKINEIRQMSGATIKIANADEGCTDRKVTISGPPETINAANYLINASMEMHKMSLTLESAASLTSAAGPTTSLASPPPVSSAQLTQAAAAVQQQQQMSGFPAMHPQQQFINQLPLLGLNMGLLDVNLGRKMFHQTKLKAPGGTTTSLIPASHNPTVAAAAVTQTTPSLVKKVDRVKFAPY